MARTVGHVSYAVVVVAAVVLDAHPAGASTIPAPGRADQEAAVAELARAAQAQDICYGWWLGDGGSTPVSQGSNLGVGVAAHADPVRCPRWIELRATVLWRPESSESEDWAGAIVVGSNEFATRLPDDAALERIGVTRSALLDDPGEVVLRGVLGLPLLAAERGLAPPVPAQTPAATSDPAALSDPGSDYWRDRGVSTVIGLGLMAVAGGVIGIGWRTARQAARSRRVGRPNPARASEPKPAPAAGAKPGENPSGRARLVAAPGTRQRPAGKQRRKRR